MKVRTSQIPEESGKPKNVDTKSKGNDAKDNDEKEQKFIRMMLNLREECFSISLFGIESIEKSFRINESVNGTGEVQPEWGIILNKDMEPNLRYPKTNVEFWYKTEEYRDKRYNDIIDRLTEAGFNFIGA